MRAIRANNRCLYRDSLRLGACFDRRAIVDAESFTVQLAYTTAGLVPRRCTGPGISALKTTQ